jgi:hypothetical protein
MKHNKNEKKKEKYKLSSEITKVTMTTLICSEESLASMGFKNTVNNLFLKSSSSLLVFEC